MHKYTLVCQYDDGQVSIDWVECDSPENAVETRENIVDDAGPFEVIACFTGHHQDLSDRTYFVPIERD